MKRYIAMFCALCCLCGLLGGCGAFRDGKYVSVVPNMGNSAKGELETIEVMNYMQMRNALVQMVESGTESAIFSLASYHVGAVHFYMDSAIAYVTEQNPVGAYVVKEIHYEVGNSAEGQAVDVEISYRFPRSEVLRIETVQTMDQVEDKVAEALSSCKTSQVLRVSAYEPLDLLQFVQIYGEANPDIVMEIPRVTIQMYPNDGSDRIITLNYTYQTNLASLQQMQQTVEPIFDAAELYVKGNKQIREKYAQLYSFLMSRFRYKIETSITPGYSLLQHGVGDPKAFANVYAKMCKNAGLECYVISGTRDAQPWTWNMVYFMGGYYHIDLLLCLENGAFQPKMKSSMEGYVWDYSAYPN